jgi:hypothetical protein
MICRCHRCVVTRSSLGSLLGWKALAAAQEVLRLSRLVWCLLVVRSSAILDIGSALMVMGDVDRLYIPTATALSCDGDVLTAVSGEPRLAGVAWGIG